MKIKDNSYELNSSEFEAALSVLNKEQQGKLINKRYKYIIVLFNISLFGYIISSLMAAFMNAIFLIYLSGMFLLMIPIVFLASLPLLYNIWHQNRLISRLGLKHVLAEPWKTEEKKKNIRNILNRIIVWSGIILIVIALILLVSILFILDVNEIKGPGENWHITDFFTIILVSVIGLSCFYISYITRSKNRSEVITRLQSSLSGIVRTSDGKSTDPDVEISREDYELIARIERAQISLNQLQSIITNTKEQAVSSDYSIRKSGNFREALKKLDLETRLSIDNQLEELAVTAKSIMPTKKSAEEILQLPMSDIPLEIYYQIDDDSKTINLISLEKTSDRKKD